MKPYYYLAGEINVKTISDLIGLMLARPAQDVTEPANFYISSTGGDIDSAIRFFDFIKSSDIKLNTVGYGQIDSAAILLFLSSENRTVISDCRMRLHLPIYNGLQSQVLVAHQEMVSLFKHLDERYFKIISSVIDKPIVQVKKLYNDGTILSPEEAKRLGFATSIASKLPIDRT
jgi:ATP-dependent protease ClpP protease subunit